jgi:hypothetical protein
MALSGEARCGIDRSGMFNRKPVADDHNSPLS